MRSVGKGEAIEVVMISDRETACNVVRHWTGAEGIRVSVMEIGEPARTSETSLTGAVGTETSEIQCITSTGNIVT